MLNSFKEITVTLQRGVTLGLKTKVLYKDSETGEVTQLLPSFPENLAMAFSPVLTTQRVKPHGKVILVTGSTSDAYLDIFKWMQACAEAKRILHFPKFQGFVFYRATRVAKAAKILEISELHDAMQARLESLARYQVHTDDIWRVYTDLDWMLELAVTSIATALWEGRLQYKHKYDALCERYPAFDRKVCEAVDALDGQYGYRVI